MNPTSWLRFGFSSTSVLVLAMLTVLVPRTAHAASASDDLETTPEDTVVVLSPLANDAGDFIDNVGFDGPAVGSFVLVGSPATAIEYTPPADFNGLVRLEYDACDAIDVACLAGDDASIEITVTAVDDPVTAADDTETVDEDDTVVVAVLANDAAPDGGVSVQSVGPAGNGTVTNNGSDVTYAPTPDFSGSDTFTYTVRDVDGDVDTATVSITVNPVDDPVTATDDAATLAEDDSVVIPVLGNDASADGGLVITSVTAPVNGTASNGGGTITYDPDPDFSGSDTFDYVVEDAFGGDSATATVTVTVDPVDDAPLAADDTATMDEDTTASIAPLGNDSPVDAGPLVIVAATASSGTVSVVGGTTLEYTPDADFFGPVTVDYEIEDGVGPLRAAATVTVTVVDTDDTPVALDDSATTDEENGVAIDVLGNDSSVDTGPLSVVSVTQGANGTVTNQGVDVDYDPNPDFYGTDSFTYTMTDDTGTSSATATVMVTVLDQDDAPVAVDDSGSGDEEQPITVPVLVNDSSVDTGPLSISSFTDGANGSVSQVGDDLVYTSDVDFFGSDSFTYTVVDATGASADTGTVSVSVADKDDAPVANPDFVVTPEDTAVTVDVLGNDTTVDTGPLSITAVTQGTNGTVAAAGTSVTYTPKLDYAGADSFTYTIVDGTGASTATGTVNVTVGEEDDAPVAVDDTATTPEDVPLTGFDPLGNDSTVDGGTLFIASASTPAGTVTVAGDGLTLDWEPPPNEFGTFTIEYVLQDTVGPSTDTGTVTVTVGAVNDVPIANDDTVITDEDVPVVIDVLANDFLFDAPVTITAAGRSWTLGGIDYPNSSNSDPTTVVDQQSGDSVTLPNGTVEIQGGSTLLYTPKAEFSGSDFIEYEITDIDGETASGRVDVTVNPVNDAPVGPDLQSFSIVENQSLSLVADGVLQPAYDPDGDPITAVLQDPATNGVVVLQGDGALTYTPNLNFTGTDSFTFFVDDGATTSTLLTVEVAITPAPPAPPPPPPGEVEFPFDLAQVPLELAIGVEPNVLIVMDDSGSMDWTIMSREPRGSRFSLSGRNRTTTYSYVFEAPTNTFWVRSGNGRVLPSEEMLAADNDFDGNDYGVWRGRNHRYNRIYYNPEVRYRPWRGLDPNNDEFADVDPTSAPFDPWQVNGARIDLTAPQRLRADNVPRFTRNWREDVETNDYYIPRYYRITDPGFTGIPAHDTPHELIEIRDPALGGDAVYPGGEDRLDCGADDGDPLTCTYEQELQNFANWFTYYRSREYTVKSSLGRVVAEQSALNIGYATLNNSNDRERIEEMNSTFRAGAKRELMDQIYRIDSNGGTPLRRSLDRAGRHFACVAGDSFGSSGTSAPGSANCPMQAAPAGACQQNFALLFTDGEWNGGTPGGIGNEDGDGNTDFDGGVFADGLSDTLADVAMRWYENDLHSGLDDLVPTTARDRGLATPFAFGTDESTTHQHMTTFTVGFGVDGRLTDADIPGDFTQPAPWGNPFTDDLSKTDDLRHAALNGRGGYLSAADPVALEEQLEAAFDEFSSGEGAASAVAFNSQQLRQNTLVYRGFYNTRDNTGDLVAQQIDEATGQLIDPPVWSAAEQLDTRSANSRVIVTWDDVTEQGIAFRHDQLNAEQTVDLDADMVNYLRGERDNERPLGRQFRERPLDEGLLGDIVNSTPVFVGPPEQFRRDSLQFPIAPADLYSTYKQDNTARRPLVYVGANDGMLHAFDADDGTEVFSYVPDKILADRPYANPLFQLTSPAYGHKYFVDGTPAVNDVFIDPTGGSDRAWSTVLIGSLRAGGKGYFALDVTDPSAYDTEGNAAAQVLWEFDDGDDTYPVDAAGNPVGGSVGALQDLQGLPVKDLGYTFSVPSVVMTNADAIGSGSETGSGGIASPEKKWAAIFGNGYNSTHGVAKLFVNFIEDGIDGWDPGDFVKLDTGFGVPAPGEQNEGLPNGLGTPRLVDLNGDGTADYGYAGDLLGNLFRFDLTDPDPANWSVTKIFEATYTDGTQQPITTQPIVTRNPQAQGVIVIFATGSFITTPDGVSSDIQSLYGIWDRVQTSPFGAEASPPTATGGRSLLVEQDIVNLQDPSFGAIRTLTGNEVVYDPATVRGWVLDFDAPRPATQTDGSINPDTSGNDPGAGGTNAQFPGERAVRNLQLRGGFLFVNTVIPRDDTSCERSPGGFAMALNPVTGGVGGLNEEIAFDLNNDGYFDSDDLAGSNVVSGLRFDDAVPTDSSFIGTRRFTQLSDRTVDVIDTNTGTSARSGRLSWRELE
jgi:Tfp pilus tip-associated adhesin PilY1